MIRAGTLCALVVPWVTAGALGQMAIQDPSSAPSEPPWPRVVRLAVTPAAEPVPALKYELLPPPIERTPGDAVTIYWTVAEQTRAMMENEEFQTGLSEWPDMPLEQLPAERIQGWAIGDSLETVAIAARRQTCQWDYPIREQGVSTLLPSLSRLRYIGRVLAVQARVNVRDGQFDGAVRRMQTVFAMSRHVADAPILIHQLVGVAMARMMCQPIEDLIAQPGSPNLYWAIGVLPRPFVDAWRGIEFERYTWYYTMHHLQRVREGQVTAGEWDPLLREATKWMATIGQMTASGPEGLSELEVAARVMRAYAAAKPWWRARGYTDEQIEAMPVGQVVLVHALAEYDRLMDESTKWFTVPFWQVVPFMRELEAKLEEATQDPAASMMADLIPSLLRARVQEARLDQRLAALQAIEAVRMHAAAHGGRLPASLAEIRQVPVPVDPMTNQPFPYRLEGDTAILEVFAPEPIGRSEQDTRYEITIVKGAAKEAGR